MKTREQFRRELQSTQDIQTVVKSMKATASAGIQQFRQAAESLDYYERAVHLALRAWLFSRPDLVLPKQDRNEKKQVGVLIFGSEQGLCGQFNQVVTEFAQQKLSEMKLATDQVNVIAMGHRSTIPLEGMGFNIEETLALPATVKGITPIVRQLIIRLSVWRQKQSVHQIILFYNHLKTRTSYDPIEVRLLPLDRGWLKSMRETPWKSRQRPLYREDENQLFQSVVDEYLFSGLYRAFAHSLASENFSRLMTMQAAEKNIGERLDNLNHAYNQFRQSQIDDELRDVIAGFEALQKP